MARLKLHALGAWLVTGIATAGDASFQGVGFLPGTSRSSVVGISADGTIAAGRAWNGAGWESFRWTSGGGLVALPIPDGVTSLQMSGMSDDGSACMGAALRSDGWWTFHWTESEGYQYLDRSGSQQSSGTAISGDGHTVVGWLRYPTGLSAFRWTSATGIVALTSPGFSAAYSTNYDGTVIGGRVQPDSTVPGGALWFGDDPPASLGNPAGGISTTIYDFSSDASIAVGQTDMIIGGWRGAILQEFGWTLLDDLPGGDDFSTATSLSPDGTTVLGSSISSVGAEAILWTQERGMRRLADVLRDDYGLSTDGWLLSGAQFSSDGSTIYGGGLNPDGLIEGYVVHLPEPTSACSTCLALLVVARFRRRQRLR